MTIKKSSSALVVASQTLLVFSALALWEFLSGRKVLDPILFSSPSLVAYDLYLVFSEGLLWVDLLVTLQAALSGLFLGMITGFLFGLLCALWPLIFKVLEPILAAFNSLPRIALAPIFILWLGIGIASKVVLVWVVVFFVVFYNIYQGILSVDPDIVKAIRVAGASQRQIVRIVILPSVFSWGFAALRTSLGFALVAAVAGEFVGANKGLGYKLMVSQGLLLSDRIYSIIIILMVVGVVVMEVSRRVETRILRWRPKSSL